MRSEEGEARDGGAFGRDSSVSPGRVIVVQLIKRHRWSLGTRQMAEAPMESREIISMWSEEPSALVGLVANIVFKLVITLQV